MAALDAPPTIVVSVVWGACTVGFGIFQLWVWRQVKLMIEPVRQEFHNALAALREELHSASAGLRESLTTMNASLLEVITDLRVKTAKLEEGAMMRGERLNVVEDIIGAAASAGVRRKINRVRH
jgi:hypothetical protein